MKKSLVEQSLRWLGEDIEEEVIKESTYRRLKPDEIVQVGDYLVSKTYISRLNKLVDSYQPILKQYTKYVGKKASENPEEEFAREIKDEEREKWYASLTPYQRSIQDWADKGGKWN
jgi:hypothetical protein